MEWGMERFIMRRFAPALMALATLTLGGCVSQTSWHAENVTGHLPDLEFLLTSDSGRPVTEKTYMRQVVLLYFGYTRCQAECPVSMARLAGAVERLGEEAKHIRILFVTLDPEHDSPEALRHYIARFDSDRAAGLTGTAADIAKLAKRYRAAYRPRSTISAPANEGITHGDAIYIFDTWGRARLLATSVHSEDDLAEDIRRLLPASVQAPPVTGGAVARQIGQPATAPDKMIRDG